MLLLEKSDTIKRKCNFIPLFAVGCDKKTNKPRSDKG
jgi:hypothetical protein